MYSWELLSTNGSFITSAGGSWSLFIVQRKVYEQDQWEQDQWEQDKGWLVVWLWSCHTVWDAPPKHTGQLNILRLSNVFHTSQDKMQFQICAQNSNLTYYQKHMKLKANYHKGKLLLMKTRILVRAAFMKTWQCRVHSNYKMCL